MHSMVHILWSMICRWLTCRSISPLSWNGLTPKHSARIRARKGLAWTLGCICYGMTQDNWQPKLWRLLHILQHVPGEGKGEGEGI